MSMTTNDDEFAPIMIRLSKYRTVNISVEAPAEYPPSVIIKTDTYETKTGQLRSYSLRVGMRSLTEFVDTLARVEEYGVQRGWIQVSDDASEGGAL
jgi:hypothetical protein